MDLPKKMIIAQTAPAELAALATNTAYPGLFFFY